MLKKTFILASLFIITVLDAQTGTNFSVDKSVIASGGGLSVGNNFSLTGTIGQSSASQNSSSATYALSGGFWAPGSLPETIFKNGFE